MFNFFLIEKRKATKKPFWNLFKSRKKIFFIFQALFKKRKIVESKILKSLSFAYSRLTLETNFLKKLQLNYFKTVCFIRLGFVFLTFNFVSKLLQQIILKSLIFFFFEDSFIRNVKKTSCENGKFSRKSFAAQGENFPQLFHRVSTFQLELFCSKHFIEIVFSFANLRWKLPK